MLPHVEDAIVAAFEDFEIVAEVICPSQLYPLDPTPVLESLSSTRRLLIVEEGIGFAGLGAELLAQVHEESPSLVQKCRRLGSPDRPIPSCSILENQLLPGKPSILNALQELVQNA
jgi:2-oxoisovalerate dehydrogenase E1 component